LPSFVTTSLWTMGGGLVGLVVYMLLGGEEKPCQPGYADGVLTTCPDFLSTELGVYVVLGSVLGLVARFLIKEL